ncbi:MAG: type II toxin-antitoxin system HicA family toxin [Rubrivivax sp.]|nr:type II toxin-antitoxin system HicA family toxin [Rubrivivax sp.]
MPELPRISGAPAVRALERLGFDKVRQSGSHVLPFHAELKVGTLAGVLRQADVSSDEFAAHL